jgi:pimeloyl-ACP methyl ester carboxylesterase
MQSETLEIGGCDIVVERLGAGEPLVVLHAEDGPRNASTLIEKLGETFEVHVPRLPGWSETRRAQHVRTVRDVALVLQEYIERFEKPVAVVGLSIGGWAAAEIAATSPSLVSKLALVSPIGVKIGGREDRDFTDFYILPEPARTAIFYAPGRAPGFRPGANYDVYLEKAVADDALVRFGWQPFMHDPGLAARLRRVRADTLILSGDHDGFILNPNYYEGYAKLIPGAHHEVIAGAGHRVEEEEPQVVAAKIAGFVGAPSKAANRRSLAGAV